MKKKLLTLAFGLLLAVGWTNVAQAQLKAESTLESLIKFGPSEQMNDEVLARKFKTQNRAPKSAPNRGEGITADKTMTRAEYEAITYNWVDANGNTHPNTKLTEPASNPYQIAYLLGTTYMNKEIPGIKYSAFNDAAHPYPNIEFGWDIPNNYRWQDHSGESITYNDITITIPSWYLDFDYIYVQSNGVTVEGGSWSYANNGTSLPSGWGGTASLSAENGGCCTQNGGGTIIIPHSIIDGKENITVVIDARKYQASSSSSNCTITISGATPESNEYTTISYAEKTWNINPTTGSGNTSGTYYPTGLTIAANGVALLRTIYVYDQNNNLLTSWTYSDATSTYSSGGNYYRYYTISGWNAETYFDRLTYNNSYYGLLSGNHINIPAATYLNGKSSIRVVITARGYVDSEEGLLDGRIVVNGEEGQPVTNSLDTYEWTITGTAAQGTRTVDKPKDNGYTVFLVKAKDNAGEPLSYTYSWNKEGLTGIVNYFDTFIDEVELLTDGLRLNENTDDAGTMFSYSGELNKFYFISKGANYWRGSSEGDNWPHYGPTYDMYEEFSPTTTTTGDQITDFYSKLLFGNSYNIIHDCRGVNPMEHYFSMSGNAGTDHKSMTNLIFWIPDNRAYNNSANNYDPEFLPHVGLYTITLDAEAEQVAQNYVEGNRNYKVNLEWVSSLNSILDFDVDQDYELWVYVYDEAGNPVEDYKVMDLVMNPNGLIHNDTEDYYYVEQKPESYTIVYRIKGWPKDATNSPGKHLEDPENGTFFALSNLDPVLIPGYENFLSLGVEHYESDFALDVEHNYYRNFLTVGNQNPDNALTAKRIKDGEDLYLLYRFDPEKVDDNGDPILTKAADLLFSADNNKIEYLIEYDNQNYVDEANLVHVDEAGVSHPITGYTDPDALGCPTYGEIANISEGGGGSTIPPVGDIQITFASGNADFRSITVVGNYGSTSWSFAQNGTNLPEGWSTTKAFTEEDDYSNSCYMSKGGTITVPATLLNGSTTVTVTINAKKYGSTYSDCDVTVPGAETEIITISDYTNWSNYSWTIDNTSSGSDEYTLLNDFLDNSTYTQVGVVEFSLPWKSIQVKLQEHAGSATDYFVIQNNGKLRFVMPAGYNNANLKFVIHNAPATSDYFDGTFTLTSSTGQTMTHTIPTNSVYGDRDYETIFTGISSGDVITITGTHTENGILYKYSPDIKYIHVYVEGGHGGVGMNDALNLDAIKFVDQFKAETKYDKHAKRYGYVLKSANSDEESGKPEIPVQHTNSKVKGFYSLDEINEDVDAYVVDPVNVMNAEVDMTLSREPEIYYYTLDRKPSTVNNANWEAVSKLQRREDDSYMEMFDNLPQYEEQICTPPTVTGTPWVVDRFDNQSGPMVTRRTSASSGTPRRSTTATVLPSGRPVWPKSL